MGEMTTAAASPWRERLILAIYGALGALAPDILILYSKRYTLQPFEFAPIQYFIATGIYVVMAATLAAVYPFRGPKTAWRGFAIGFTLPVVLSGLLSMQRGEVSIPKGGGTVAGTLLDLMSLW
jgi:hypothetical protein